MHGSDQDAKRDALSEGGSPSIVAWLASLAAIAVIAATLVLPRGDNRYLPGAGAFLLVLGAVFAFAPFFLLRKHKRPGDGKSYMQTEDVVDRGLYAITRHPQYLGYMMLACGFAFLSQHWAALVLAAAAVALFYYQAVKEERYCLGRLGVPYEPYLRRVPRFNVILGIARLLRRLYVRRW